MQGFRIVGALYAKIPYYVVLYMQTKLGGGALEHMFITSGTKTNVFVLTLGALSNMDTLAN